MKITKNEQGFSAVELIMVIVIIALIGVVGWMVYKNHHKTTTATVVTVNKSTVKTPTSQTTTTVNPYDGWKTYGVDGISFMYPSSWTIGSSSEVVSASSIPYNPGAVPTNQPKYNNNLVFTVQLPIKGETYSTPSSTPIGKGLILQSGMTINGASNFCLIGNANQTPGQAEPVTTNSNVAQIEVSPCDSSAKTTQDFLSTTNDKTNFTVLIVSGNPESNSPLVLNSNDYLTTKLIAESMKF